MKCKNCGAEFEGKFCPRCGQAPEPLPIVPPKKPFYKRKWFIALIVVAVLLILGKVIVSGPSKDTTTFKWESISLSQALPKPESDTCTRLSDEADSLVINVCDISEKQYGAYVEECTEKYGFTNNKFQTENTFSADNGTYSLSLRYKSGKKEMYIELDLLKTDTPSEDVTEQTEETKAAEKVPEKKDTPAATEATEKQSTSDVIGKDFKAAMDSYEKFMDEYIAFMKKYNKSGGTDMTLLTDYTNYLTKYADVVKKFEKWEDDDLNDAETVYYLEVQTRVAKKLTEAALS